MERTSFPVPLADAPLPPFRYPCFRSENLARLPCPSTGHWVLDVPQSGMGQLGDRHAHSLTNRGRIRPDLHAPPQRGERLHSDDHQLDHFSRDHGEPAGRWPLLRSRFQRESGLAVFGGHLAFDDYRWLDDRCPALSRRVSCRCFSRFESLSSHLQHPRLSPGSDRVYGSQTGRPCL